jgi:hypothetical protein
LQAWTKVADAVDIDLWDGAEEVLKEQPGVLGDQIA